jgi:hypothetical protein
MMERVDATHLGELGVEEAFGVCALGGGSILDGVYLVLVPEQQNLLPVLHDHAPLPARQRRQGHHGHPRRTPGLRRRGRLRPRNLGGAAGEPGGSSMRRRRAEGDDERVVAGTCGGAAVEESGRGGDGSGSDGRHGECNAGRRRSRDWGLE